MKKFNTIFVAVMFLSLSVRADDLPDPDGKEADMKKPVQVYILLGQSNMLGFGKVGTLKGVAKNLYPYLVDDSGNWTTRKDVRNVRIMCSGNNPANSAILNDWLNAGTGIGKGKQIGPEIGIGHYLGNATKAPVLILKSCIGNRSLGWDLLPPGSKQYTHGGKIQAGYGEVEGGIPKEKAPGKWYAGCQYDGDIGGAKNILKNISKYYPGAKNYEVAGFFWWQGDKDMRVPAHYEKYEDNLINLLAALRRDFNAPKARLVCASLGQTKEGSGGGGGAILKAMKNIADPKKYPANKGLVGFVYSHPLSKGSSSSAHYGGNPETYMNIGEAMGKAMVGILKKPMTDADFKKSMDENSRGVLAALKSKKFATAADGLKLLKTNLEILGKSTTLDEDKLAGKQNVYDILESQYRDAISKIAGPVKESRRNSDYYKLSIDYKNAKRYLAGTPELKELAEEVEEDLKSKEGKKEISNGKKFHTYINSCLKAESRSKKPRTEKKAEYYKKNLEKMADKFEDSVYEKAARKAAREVTDPKNKFQEPSYYMR